MNDVRAYYFRTLARMTRVLATISDPPSAGTFWRLGRLLRLLDLRTAAGDAPSLDLQRSGLPILKEIISVSNDIQDGARRSRQAIADVKTAMLDEMLAQRRLPGERLRGEAAAALYDEELSGDLADVFQPDAERSFASGIVRPDLAAKGPWGAAAPPEVHAAWDFWDGTTSRAIRVQANFYIPAELGGTAALAEVTAVAAIANRFSSDSFTPLTLADEIDEAMENLRLKKLTKVTVGPFISDVFSKTGDPLMETVRMADDLEEAWAIRWTVDTLLSAGTKMVGGGFLASPRAQETFHVTLDDPDCAQRGVTEFRHHVAMPHGMFQRIAEQRDEHSSLRSASIHVLAADDRLIENA
jgi:hypothetical protein